MQIYLFILFPLRPRKRGACLFFRLWLSFFIMFYSVIMTVLYLLIHPFFITKWVKQYSYVLVTRWNALVVVEKKYFLPIKWGWCHALAKVWSVQPVPIEPCTETSLDYTSLIKAWCIYPYQAAIVFAKLPNAHMKDNSLELFVRNYFAYLPLEYLSKIN